MIVVNVGKIIMNLGKILLFITFFNISSFLYSDDSIWLTDFELAKQQSEKKHLPILVNFTGSDWCPYCKKLENEVFSKPEFLNYVKENFVILKIDFPQNHKLAGKILKIHKKLAEKYKVKEFPAVVFLDKNGEFILKTGYRDGGVQSYISFLKIVKKIAVSL